MKESVSDTVKEGQTTDLVESEDNEIGLAPPKFDEFPEYEVTDCNDICEPMSQGAREVFSGFMFAREATLRF